VERWNRWVESIIFQFLQPIPYVLEARSPPRLFVRAGLSTRGHVVLCSVRDVRGGRHALWWDVGGIGMFWLYHSITVAATVIVKAGARRATGGVGSFETTFIDDSQGAY
jgi:hypothetical protein